MSKKPPLSPILKAMREHLHNEVRGMHDVLGQLDALAKAKDLITNNRPVAQALANAFYAANAPVEVPQPEPADPAPFVLYNREKVESLLSGETLDLGMRTVVKLSDEGICHAMVFFRDAFREMDRVEEQPDTKRLAPYDIFIGPEALRTLLQGGTFETSRNGRAINVQLTRGALETVDSLVGSTYGEEDVIAGDEIDAQPATTIANKAIPAVVVEEQRVEAIQAMQEARGQEPQEARPSGADQAEKVASILADVLGEEMTVIETTLPNGLRVRTVTEAVAEDPVDEVDYEVQALPEEEAAGADMGGEDVAAVQPEPEKKPVRLVPRISTNDQQKTEDKLVALFEAARAKTSSEGLMFTKTVLAEKIGESEMRVMAAIGRLSDKGVVSINSGAPKTDVSLTFHGAK